MVIRRELDTPTKIVHVAEIRIPEEYELGVFEIRELEDGQVSALLAALESEPPTINRVELQTRVASKVGDTIPRGELDRIMEVLSSLYGLRDSMAVRDVSDFAEIICDAMDASDTEELWFEDEEERVRFKGRLVKLLSVESLDVAARATDLMYEHEHTVHGPMRVVTDIRPIFGPDPEDDPKGAVIVHTLKISYHEGRQVKEFFISLDSEQVNELMGTLGRANSKAESLKRTWGRTNVPHIEAE